MRWVGIDEAGYGPNLGPLVMTAVIAEGPDDRAPDLWGDLAATVARAGDTSERLWVDDSKAILHAGKGRDRLEAACLMAVAAAGGAIPNSLGGLLAALDAGTLAEAELSHWLDGDDPALPHPAACALLDRAQRDPPVRGGGVAARGDAVGRGRSGAVQRRPGAVGLEGEGPLRRVRPAAWLALEARPPAAASRTSTPTSMVAATSISTRS